MVAEDLIKALEGGDLSIEEVPYQQRGYWFDIKVPKDRIVEVAEAINERGYYIEDVLCVDYVDRLEVLYHFNHWEDPRRLSVRVEVAPSEPELPSIWRVYPGAAWHEREIHEFFGLRFKDHPNLAYLFLHEGIDFYPMRKERVEVSEEDRRLLNYLPAAAEEDTFWINMGPQHPSTHGVLRLILKMRGEYIEQAEPVLGYMHRMQEKMAEVRTYQQYYPNTARLDYVGPLAFSLCFVGAMERLCELEVPERAQYIRTITLELNRISSHLLWLGTFLLDLGATTPYFFAFDDREQILDLLEGLTGSRLTFSYYRIGGLYEDLNDGFLEGVKRFVERMWKRFEIYDDLVTGNIIFVKRTKDVGVIPKEVARRYGATGPTLRGSGVPFDIRQAEPYAAYGDLQPEVVVGERGDSYDRYLVRLEEMKRSLRVLEEALEKVPEGPYKLEKVPKKPVPGDVYFATESPRGEVGIYIVSDGSDKPYRLKWRSPCFSNLATFTEVVKGQLIADAVATLGSLDLVIPEMDR